MGIFYHNVIVNHIVRSYYNLINYHSNYRNSKWLQNKLFCSQVYGYFVLGSVPVYLGVYPYTHGIILVLRLSLYSMRGEEYIHIHFSYNEYIFILSEEVYLFFHELSICSYFFKRRSMYAYFFWMDYILNVIVCVYTIQVWVLLYTKFQMQVWPDTRFRFEYDCIPKRFRFEYDCIPKFYMWVWPYIRFRFEYHYIQVVDELPPYTFLPFFKHSR
jgi:hypothetical protein